MEFIPIKTRAFRPPRDNLFDLLDESLARSRAGRLREGDALFITSKILAIHQARTVKIPIDKKSQEKLKTQLIKREARAWLPPSKVAEHDFYLTIKDHALIPSAGIDESNGRGYYVLWPRNVNGLLKELRSYLKNKFKIKKLALVATDSHTQPLRAGVTGISVGFYGLEPLYDYRGKKDVFGRTLKYTRANIVDVLSSMAVLMMGEGSERTPLLVLRGAKFIKFVDIPSAKKITIAPKQDLYYPILKHLYERKYSTKRTANARTKAGRRASRKPAPFRGHRRR